MCGRFVEINHAKQQINAFSGNLFIPLTNRHNLWIIIPKYPPAPADPHQKLRAWHQLPSHHSWQKPL